MLQLNNKEWWETDSYTDSEALSAELNRPDFYGPNDVALVRAYENGATQEGWGLTGKKDEDTGKPTEGFMPRYTRGEFLPRRALYGYKRDKHEFAIVMRSTRLVCVDIDGKNGGFTHAPELGALPRTLAERSKSGNGFHLFYSVDDEWDEALGFEYIPDNIGIVQGVDIRGVGCVYHFHGQLWNDAPVVALPQYLEDRLLVKKQARAAAQAQLQKLSTLDETDQLLEQSKLLDELKRPIPAGRRNTTLFAIGGQLRAAGVQDWGKHIQARATALKLDSDEIHKLINNITNYS